MVQGLEILAEVLLLGAGNAVAVDGHGDGQQDDDDADGHHHLDEGETAVGWFTVHLAACHLSGYHLPHYR